MTGTQPSPLPKIRLALLGSTGSIGQQTLDIIRAFPDRFEVVALSAAKQSKILYQQCLEFKPKRVCLSELSAAEELKVLRQPGYWDGDVFSGETGLCDLIAPDDIDVVVIGIVGIKGLFPTLAALQSGKKVFTANKETFVAAGHLVEPYLQQIIPLDSEHSAIHQCLFSQNLETLQPEKPLFPHPHQAKKKIQRLILTASGGPFRDYPLSNWDKITKTEALNHPNWVMGPKVTIDSATLMNKGLEVIEAHWLYGLPYEQIQVLIHPQSIVHSAVEMVDGSILSQMGAPDMRGPILYALSYPERWETPFQSTRLDLSMLQNLQFNQPDLERFPCLSLAYQAASFGPTGTTILNAADEVVVEAFLNEQLSFAKIPFYIESALKRFEADNTGFKADKNDGLPTLAEIQHWDSWSRRITQEAISSKPCLA
ncbi:MAG: 1-deoxy-D-xylulose-5-phosphate reductoisomerase [Cyanobacteria bacterium]|nr:1-deoxy-D-xylulose-5-phosphate reductoisomerase [Cyanobacteriota bacterium]